MEYFVNYKCDIHPNIFECPDNIICFNEEKEVHGVIIHDGGTSFILIDFCPWCGKRLNIPKNQLKYR